MGWTVTRHKTGLYSLYSTVSDEYLLRRVTRRRVIKYMAQEFQDWYMQLFQLSPTKHMQAIDARFQEAMQDIRKR